MRRIVFEAKCFQDFTDWAANNKRIFNRIIRLIREVQRTPFEGIGKPEPLKHELSGYWSRRIDQEHRLVYKADDEMVIIISCKYHYDN